MSFLPAAVASALLSSGLLPADPPAAGAPAAAGLVEQLGDADFHAREAASKRLAELGPAALEPLRAACRADDPEVARRAAELVARIERQVANERVLAPTLVELAAEDAPLAAVLADLARQSGYGLGLGGPRAGELAGKKVTLRTAKVPFWEAVLAVCDAGDLQIASAGGFLAPGVATFSGGSLPPMRPLPNTFPPNGLGAVTGNLASPAAGGGIVLEPRTGPRRPAAVYGAVLVEAFPAPGSPDSPAALLQVWPEPRLNWQQAKAVRVDRAADEAGRVLAADATPAEGPILYADRRAQVVRQLGGGGVIILNADSVPAPAIPGFTPNARQAVVRLKPGERTPATLREFAGSVFGTVRSGPEPLATAELDPGRLAAATGAGVELRATLLKPVGGPAAVVVELSYDPSAVSPGNPQAAAGRRPPDPRQGVAARANPYGLQITDADGRPFTAYAVSASNRVVAAGRQMTTILRLNLTPAEAGQGEPDTITFWGSYDKPVEVPFALKGVPLGGKK
jgi:hypothetical protein